MGSHQIELNFQGVPAHKVYFKKNQEICVLEIFCISFKISHT